MSDRATAEAAAHAANSETSFYVLLTLPETYHPTAETPVPPPIPPALLRKSYRQTSLRYHPDKNPSPDAAATFHTLTTAYNVLGDVATKAVYDQALFAQLVRKRKSEAMDVQRRRMKEDLEAREHAAAVGVGMAGVLGAKRQKMDEERELEKRLEKLREEGVKLKMKREEALRKAEMEKKAEFEGKRRRSQEPEATTTSYRSTDHPPSISSASEARFSDLDKTVFIKFHTEPPKHSEDQLHPILINDSTLRNSFSKFGKITSCLVREPPKTCASASTFTTTIEEKEGSKRKKKKKNSPSTTTAVLVFESILAAYDVVHRFRTGGSDDPRLWQRVKDVKFAMGGDPDLSGILAQRSGGGGGHESDAGSNSGHVLPARNAKAMPAHTYTSPSTFIDSDSNAPKQAFPFPSPSLPRTTPTSNSATTMSTARPKFSFHNPQAEPRAQTTGASPRLSELSPTDYESRTLMRMREMERRSLQAEIEANEANEVNEA